MIIENTPIQPINIDDDKLEDINDIGREDKLLLNGDIANEENQHQCSTIQAYQNSLPQAYHQPSKLYYEHPSQTSI